MPFGNLGKTTRVDEIRALRVALAILDDATWEFQAVITETIDDERKYSLVALIVALGLGIGDAWLSFDGVNIGMVRESVAFKLIEIQETGDENG